MPVYRGGFGVKNNDLRLENSHLWSIILIDQYDSLVRPQSYQSYPLGTLKDGIHADYSENVAEDAADIAMRRVIPLAENHYKVQITKALVKRAILSAR